MELFLSVVTHPFLWIFIGLVGVAYGIQWLVSQKGTLFDITGLIQTSFGLNHVPKYVIRLVWYLWIILILAMLFSISYALYNIILMISSPDTKLESLSVSAYALPAMVVPLSALIAFPITVLRQHYNRRQTEAEEEGLITDRINSAVASLGADKIVKGSDGKETTEPNIEVRVGAILALERLAEKNDDVHVQIMETLCSYLRENTPKHVEKPREMMAIFYKNYRNPRYYWKTRPDLHVFQYNMPEHRLPDPLEAQSPREDVQMALTVIGRRKDQKIGLEIQANFWIDLQRCHLERANLKGAKLNGAVLNGAVLNLAVLEGARLDSASLNNASLEWASLRKASLNWADLQAANMEEASLYEASLNHAKLNVATDLTQTLHRLVRVRSVDYTEVTISDTQLDDMFGDASVTLAPHHTRPDHWPEIVLDRDDFDTEYEKWVEDPEGYTFDRTLYEPGTP